MSSRAHQAQAEWSAGYQSGLNGELEPRKDRGASFYGGWLAGKAERETECTTQ